MMEPTEKMALKRVRDVADALEGSGMWGAAIALRSAALELEDALRGGGE